MKKSVNSEPIRLNHVDSFLNSSGSTSLMDDFQPQSGQELRAFQRIAVVGPEASGKTTLAEELADHLDLNHIDLKELRWRPHWQKIEDPVFLRAVRDRVAKARWALSGDVLLCRSLVLARAELIVCLGLPRTTALRQGLTRSIRRIWSQQAFCNGNRETFQHSFLSTKSPIAKILRAHNTEKETLAELCQQAEKLNTPVIQLRSRTEVDNWLTQFIEDQKIKTQ